MTDYNQNPHPEPVEQDSKRNTPFVFDDCMYYGDDDVTVDVTKEGTLSYNKFREGAYDGSNNQQ